MLADISGTKTKTTTHQKKKKKAKIEELETVRSKILWTYIGTSLTLRGVTSLELI
jgi:hypothetical protein